MPELVVVDRLQQVIAAPFFRARCRLHVGAGCVTMMPSLYGSFFFHVMQQIHSAPPGMTRSVTIRWYTFSGDTPTPPRRMRPRGPRTPLRAGAAVHPPGKTGHLQRQGFFPCGITDAPLRYRGALTLSAGGCSQCPRCDMCPHQFKGIHNYTTKITIHGNLSRNLPRYFHGKVVVHFHGRLRGGALHLKRRSGSSFVHSGGFLPTRLWPFPSSLSRKAGDQRRQSAQEKDQEGPAVSPDCERRADFSMTFKNVSQDVVAGRRLPQRGRGLRAEAGSGDPEGKAPARRRIQSRQWRWRKRRTRKRRPPIRGRERVSVAKARRAVMATIARLRGTQGGLAPFETRFER